MGASCTPVRGAPVQARVSRSELHLLFFEPIKFRILPKDTRKQGLWRGLPLYPWPRYKWKRATFHAWCLSEGGDSRNERVGAAAVLGFQRPCRMNPVKSGRFVDQRAGEASPRTSRGTGASSCATRPADPPTQEGAQHSQKRAE